MFSSIYKKKNVLYNSLHQILASNNSKSVKLKKPIF
jgi:hypothetical protein